MILDLWAARWGIPLEAVADLKWCMGMLMATSTPPAAHDPNAGAPGSESRQQSLTRIDASQNGVWLTRNNVGCLNDLRGVPVRYGLCNESKEQNSKVKSADLIGIRPLLIGPHHIGTTIGQFVSREIKHEGWKWKGDKHEVAQLNWCNFVLSKGGDAAFCTGPGSFNK